MPLQKCTDDKGRPGWQYGNQACYAYTPGDAASEKEARRKAVQQALAIGGGKPPSDLADDVVDALSDADVDAILLYADGTQPADQLPDGVVRCTMNGTPGFRGDGGPTSACHIHDGTPAGIRSAIAKAIRDRGTVNPPPKGMSELETEDLHGVPLMAAGGPYYGQGSPPDGDFFDDDYLQTVARETAALADEVRIPIKLGHTRGQKLLKNSGLFADEMPAAGWVDPRSLRVAGGQLIGDLRAVPKKLAQLVKTHAFRTRSVELSRIESQKQGGKTFENVITGLALLGAKAPAIRTLDDIVALYTEAEPFQRFGEGVTATPLIIFATTTQESTDRVDTSTMTQTAATPSAETSELTDDQIEQFATSFGISEDDPAKRRAAVLSKFAELAPRDETQPTPSTPPPSPAPPTTPAPGPGAPAVAMSEDEARQLREDAALGRRAYDEHRKAKISANVALAIKQGKIAPADAEQWGSFMERDYEFAVTQLKALPIRRQLLAAFGSDESGADGQSRAQSEFDRAYDQWAGMTGVPRQVTTTVGGNQ